MKLTFNKDVPDTKFAIKNSGHLKEILFRVVTVVSNTVDLSSFQNIFYWFGP